ncbi:transient receptor potential-gamma protein-like isoform X2 [Montipora foliosa]|uniref:transient receptor potential-gamma protein-like isoform X2 n=1 Tax=Montipora foliosa TaxID=591990 RepID=UPI0035F20151
MEATSILLQTIGDEDVSPLNKKRERELCDAIEEQDLEKLKFLISSSSTEDLNHFISSGKTLLLLAGEITEESVRNDFIKELLNNGADLGVTLLHDIRDSNVEILTRCNGSNGIVTGKLASALHLLSTYRVRASPVYIAASFLRSDFGARRRNSTGSASFVPLDPVYRACQMNQTLRNMAKQEYEFSKEYEELSDICNGFVVALLNECRSMEEIQYIMQTNVGETASCKFKMLEFAIKTKSDKFVSHPYCQLLLDAEVYKGVSFLERSTWNQVLFTLLASVLFPVLFLIWLVFECCCPNHKIAKMFHAPCVRFLIYCGLYQLFLFLLIITSWASVYSHYAFNDWLVLSFIIGLLVDVIKDLYDFGIRSFFSHVSNRMALATVVFFVSHYIIWWSAWAVMSRDGVHSPEHYANHELHDIMLVSEGVLAIGILLAFFHNLSFMQASSSIGPLLGAFVEMMYDVGKFALYFFFIFLGFAVSFTKLYTQYLAGRSYFLSQVENATSERHAGNLGESISEIFWALFGELDRDNFRVPEKGFEILTIANLIIFGAFNIAAVLVALNMLIAILNESYSRISEKLYTSWRFLRAKMWLRWIQKKGVLPPPINVLYVFGAVSRVFKHLASGRGCAAEESIETTDPETEERREVIRQLVLRYQERNKKNGTKLNE